MKPRVHLGRTNVSGSHFRFLISRNTGKHVNRERVFSIRKPNFALEQHKGLILSSGSSLIEGVIVVPFVDLKQKQQLSNGEAKPVEIFTHTHRNKRMCTHTGVMQQPSRSHRTDVGAAAGGHARNPAAGGQHG